MEVKQEMFPGQIINATRSIFEINSVHIFYIYTISIE